MVTIPDFNELMVAFQHGAIANRDRYSRWFTKHPTKTMLQTIVEDLSPASTGTQSGFEAYEAGESMTVFDFETFLNNLVATYVGKQKFLDEAKDVGTITEAQHRNSTELVSRHLAALVNNGAETLRKDGALLSFNAANRLEVSLVEGDDMAIESSKEILAVIEEEEAPAGTTFAVMDAVTGTVNIPNFYKVQALFPWLVEDVLLRFSQSFFSAGSEPQALADIAAHNADSVEQMEKKFESLTKLFITATDFLDFLTSKGIAYAAQKKFLKYLLTNRTITKAVYDEHNATVDNTYRTLLASAAEKLAGLNVRLSYDTTARLVIERIA
jgi:hypothetical protein